MDGTQAVGKLPLDLTDVDLFTCSAHKIFGLKGIACLVKKQKIELEPLIHGGKSQTIYRSGTPALALMVSMAKAVRLICKDVDQNWNYVASLNHLLRSGLSKIKGVVIHSDPTASPYILNFSVPLIKPETMIHSLEAYEVYISTNTACSSSETASSTLEALKKDPSLSRSSLRISLSYLTSEEDVLNFLKIFEKCYQVLKRAKEED